MTNDALNSVLLFAAGLGTRMRPLTGTRPKPLVQVADRTLLDHALDLCTDASLSNIVVNAHYKSEMIYDHLRDHPVQISDESDQLLDTGGGLRKAASRLGPGPAFTMNTDAVWQGPNPFQMLARAWNPDVMDALLLLIPPENALGTTSSGDFTRDQEGRIIRGPGSIYTGCQIIKPDLCENGPDGAFSLNVIWDQLIEKNTIFGVEYSGRWCDVGSPQNIALAETLL